MIRFRRRSCSLVLACVVEIVVLVVGGGDSLAALSETYGEYVKSDATERREEWISRFQHDLASADANDPAFYHSLNVLGDLYESTGDRRASIQVRASLLDDIRAPALIRMDAGVKAIGLMERTSGKPSLLLQMSNQVREVFTTRELGYSRDAFVVPIQRLRLRSAQWTYAAGKQEADELVQQSQTAEANTRLLAAMTRADVIANEYISEWASLREAPRNQLATLNAGLESATYLRGELAEAMSRIYTQQGEATLAAATRNKGEQMLNVLLEQYPKSVRYSQPAAVLLIQMKRVAGASDTDIVPYIRDLMSRVVPGHAVLNLLSDFAMETARTPEGGVLADRLFQLLLQQEEAWFPETYRQHINYQVCLLESTVNLINMDRLSEAGDHIRKLLTLGIADAKLLERLDQVKKAYGRKFSGATAADMEKLYMPPAAEPTTSVGQARRAPGEDTVGTGTGSEGRDAAIPDNDVERGEQSVWCHPVWIAGVCLSGGVGMWAVLRRRLARRRSVNTPSQQ